MKKYQHTQSANYIILPIATALVISTIAVSFVEVWYVSVITVLLFAFIALGFYALTVEIDDEYIRLKFGIGYISKKFALSDIVAVKPIKTNFWYGWGIHWIGRGWVYNVSGFDAVEITTKSGRISVIGTDEPDKLTAAIKANIS